jgi:hypothetical protein
MDELHGIFIAYEMRMETENSIKKEIAFKYSNKKFDPNSNDVSNMKE